MNRFEFGVLVASLRNDLGWTQKDLAKKCGLETAVISNIERGQRRTLTGQDIPVKLANGFRLTSLERMEFILAAGSVTGDEKPRRKNTSPAQQPFDPDALLKRAGRQIAGIALPVFVTDAFCDIVLANHCVIDFYGIPPALLQSAGTVTGGYNILRYIFDPLSNFLDSPLSDEWERLALNNTRYFRRQTLRVRSKPYFAELLKELRDPEKYPSFDRCWQKILFDEFDDHFLSITRSQDPESEHSFVSVETLLTATPCGELYLHQILPLNRRTAERITGCMKRTGQGYQLFAPFPDKRKY